jgi:hypothetical protein
MATTQVKKIKQSEEDAFEVKFQACLNRKTLLKDPPVFLKGNLAHPVRVLNEDELIAGTRQFFDEFEAQMAYYSERLDHDVTWLTGWLKRYWAAWSGGIDEDLVRQTVAEDVVYKDPTAFGRPMVGVQNFIDYNQAFFDAATDLRYDALPGLCSVQVSPSGEVLFMARYSGCGHWDKPLRMHPWTKGARAIPATGAFVQLYPVDRYHFNADHQLCRGETLWDPMEAMQLISLLPSDTSLLFRGMMQAGSVGALATRLSRRLPLIGAR